MTIDLLTHTIAIGAGVAGGFIIAGLFVNQKLRRTSREAWKEAEKLHRARAIQDLRDNTSARLP